MKYEVIVGNIGTVYDGDSKREALDTRTHYITLASSPGNRATLEDVTILEDGELFQTWLAEEQLNCSQLAHANGIEKFDTATPDPWFKAACNLAGENIVGQVVWSYDGKNIFGDPVGVTEFGREIVRRMQEEE